MSELRSRAFTVVRALLGLVLLSAAALKIYGWSVSSVPPVGWFSAPGVQAAAIGWEILLGTWLLVGIAPLGSWVVAIGTFTLLAGISAYLGWIGQATCGCFGTIKASPWHAFTVDVATLVLLVTGRPEWESIKSVQDDGFWRLISLGAYFVLGVSAIVASLAGIGTWVYGSPEVALAHLRGELVVVTPEYVDCGSGKPGEILEANVAVHNWDDQWVRVYGGTSDCSCITTKGLPVTIPPRGSLVIPVILKVPMSTLAHLRAMRCCLRTVRSKTRSTCESGAAWNRC